MTLCQISQEIQDPHKVYIRMNSDTVQLHFQANKSLGILSLNAWVRNATEIGGA
jgi:hypothetical protein